MADGNWSTMLRAIEKWSLRCCGKVGKRLAGDNDQGLQQDTLDNIIYVGKFKTQEDAGQNGCVLAAEQECVTFDSFKQPQGVNTYCCHNATFFSSCAA